MAQRERVANKIVDVDAGTVRFDFLGKPDADGKRPVVNSITVRPSDFPAEIQKRFLLNGVAQKLGDSYADSEDGTPFENVKALIDQLMGGTWAARGEGGQRTSYLLRAVMEATGADEEQVRKTLDSLSNEDKKKLSSDPAVAPIIARMKAEDAAKRAQSLAESTKGKESILSQFVKGGAAKGNKKGA